MKLYLVDRSKEMIASWKHFFKNNSEVHFHHGSIFDLKGEVQCFVSPANAFCWMNGGIDLAYSEFFGWDLQKRLQELLKSKHQGELLVGQAEWIATNHSEVTHLISAPTMRVPEVLAESANAYLASRAAFRIALANNAVSIAFPGMGTGVGQMPYDVCAKQMHRAYEEVVLGKAVNYSSLHNATKDHYSLVV